jgi:hypothetical protein
MVKNKVYTGTDFATVWNVMNREVERVYGHENKYAFGTIAGKTNIKSIDDILSLWHTELTSSYPIPVFLRFPETNLHPKDQVRLIEFIANYWKENKNEFVFIIRTLSNYVIEACEIYFRNNVEFFNVESEDHIERVSSDNIDILYKSFADVLQKLENDRSRNDDEVSYEE